mgnify:CR=1 FL=1
MSKKVRSSLLDQHVYAREPFSFPGPSVTSTTSSPSEYYNLSESVEGDGVHLKYTVQEYPVTPEIVQSYLPDAIAQRANIASAPPLSGGDFAALQRLPKSMSELSSLKAQVDALLSQIQSQPQAQPQPQAVSKTDKTEVPSDGTTL